MGSCAGSLGVTSTLYCVELVSWEDASCFRFLADLVADGAMMVAMKRVMGDGGEASGRVAEARTPKDTFFPDRTRWVVAGPDKDKKHAQE